MANSEHSSTEPAFDLGTFTRGLAHELANPLNALAMNAEVARLLIERNESQRAKERLAALIADCSRCGRLLHGIRRFGAGMSLGEPKSEPTTVAALVNAASASLKRDEPSPAVDLHGAEATVVVDRMALQRVFEELLRNSVEAGAKGVRIAVSRQGSATRIDCIDDGAGIPSALHDKIFEPFFSTRRNEGNAGLGLTLVQELVRANAGSLDVLPGTERGTCVRIELPDRRG
jgi:C4-dicarboxylate-specific signal transduction histidine kinase